MLQSLVNLPFLLILHPQVNLAPTLIILPPLSLSSILHPMVLFTLQSLLSLTWPSFLGVQPLYKVPQQDHVMILDYYFKRCPNNPSEIYRLSIKSPFFQTTSSLMLNLTSQAVISMVVIGPVNTSTWKIIHGLFIAKLRMAYSVYHAYCLQTKAIWVPLSVKSSITGLRKRRSLQSTILPNITNSLFCRLSC